MNATTKNNSLSIDLLTILAIGIVSFILKNVIHEALGVVRLSSFPRHTSTAILEQ